MREFELLEHVYRANPRFDERVLIPPGDDMAMVAIGGVDLLVAVDQLVAGRHVDLARTPLSLVGRKAITRSLSDVAAMAATPVATLAAVTLPSDFADERAKELFDAMRETAAHYHCPLVGGDIACHSSKDHPLVCSTTVFAQPAAPGRQPVTRAGARVGDRVWVTGELGGSMGPDGLGRHLTFEPRIDEAIALAETLGDELHAMIDLSDGLGRDLGHIAVMSSVRIEVDVHRLPCRNGLDWRRAVTDGEDYELCFTAGGNVPGELGNLPITEIGRVMAALAPETPSPDLPDTWPLTFIDGSTRVRGDQLGWEHASSAGDGDAD